MRFPLFVWLPVVVALACAEGDVTGPEETLGRFVGLVERASASSRALEEAFALLDRDAQAELARRADKAQALSGRDFQPWQMLAEGRFRMRIPTASAAMSVEMQGERRALVTVQGGEAGDPVAVPMVRQGGRWRVVLKLPGMAGVGSDATVGPR